MTKFFIATLSFLSCIQLFAASSAGSNSDELDSALATENGIANGEINFTQDVTLLSGATPTQVRAVNANGDFTFAGNSITINGNGNNLNGNSSNVRGFFIGGDGASLGGGLVTINDLNFQNCNVQGGGSELGGGGMGAGGGLFVYKNAKACLKNCTFSNCSAQGGGSFIGSGGGGGMKGNGGSSNSGGGGFGGDAGSVAGALKAGGGGCSDFPIGDGSTTTPGNNFANSGAAGGSGVGGNAATPDGGFGGGGAGGGSGLGSQDGGGGNFGGGGGGSNTLGGIGGNGGFGGGAGTSRSTGSIGGCGGGGGTFSSLVVAPFGGPGGFGGGDGDGSLGSGGAGAGFGGAIFLMDGSELTIEGSINFTNNDVLAGSGLLANTDPLAGFGKLGKDIFMMSGSTIIFDLSSDVLLANPIEGNQGDETPNGFVSTSTGGLTKKGTALLSLSGDNTFTGLTTVEAGELRINSSIVTDVVVDAGGKLSGNFSVKQDATGGNGGNLTNHGIVCPGVSGVGQINLEGDFIQESSGILVVDITPTGNVNDKVFFTMGSAMLSGTMEVILNSGNYIAGTTYEVINGPTNGTQFDTVLKTGGFGQLIDLQVDYSSVIITILNTVLFEGQNIDSGPPTDVANCIIAADIAPGSDFAFAVELLGTLNDKQVNEALTSLSAVRYGALEWINERNNSYAAEILSQHLLELCCSPSDCCATAWISVFGNMMNNQKKLDYLPKYNADAVGVLLGIDSCRSCCFTYGGAFGYTHTDLLWKNDGGKGDLDSFYGSLYASWNTGCCIITDLSILGGGTSNDLKRNIEYGSFDSERGILPLQRTAKSDFWSYFVTTHLGLRTPWNCGCSTLEWYGLADYHYFTHGSFKEKGANSLNLVVKSKDQNFIRGESGIRWRYEVDCECYCFSPYIGLSWVGEFPIGKSKQPASFVGQSCTIDALSYDSSVQLGSPQAGIKWSHCNGASFMLGYKGLFNNSVRINEIEGRVDWSF